MHQRRYQWKWTEGSWTIVQPLTGQTEVAQLRGPDRDGFYKKMRSRDLRGGGDGKTFGLADASATADKDGDVGYSTSGEACVKYLGGPMRSYTGKAMQSTMLEVVIRPPITTLEDDLKATGTLEQLEWESVGRILTKAKEASKDSEKEGDDIAEASINTAAAVQTSSKSTSSDNTPSATLNKKLGMDFENVGGLDKQLDDIARRVLASRANPAAARKLGVSHVRGILLSGEYCEYIILCGGFIVVFHYMD